MEEEMAVKLPKDAEGREIPLDTTKLFGAGGTAYNITRWIYMTDFHTNGSRAGQWRVATDTCGKFDPGLMYLTPPDSREQLEEDSTAFDGGQTYGPCHYFHELGDDRMPCPARDDACEYHRAKRVGGGEADMGIRCPDCGGQVDSHAGHIDDGRVSVCGKGRPPTREAGYRCGNCDSTAISIEKCEPKGVDHD